MSQVGKEIRRRRQEKGWSQAKLGVLAEVGPAGVSLIETGRRNPSATTLVKIAEALGVEVPDLFPKAQPPLPDPLEETKQRDLRPVALSPEQTLSTSLEEFEAAIEDVESVSELDRLGRLLIATHRRALDEDDLLKAEALYYKRRALWERIKELDPPLAEIQYRTGEKPLVIFYRDPTPEERTELEERLGTFDAVEPAAVLS